MLDIRFVQYLHDQCSPKDAPGILGVIGFGVAPGADPRYGFPFAQVDIPVLGQSPFYEVWNSDLRITRDAHGGIESAHDSEVLFGVLQPEETARVSLESSAYGAYLEIFDHIERAGYPYLLRVFHYLPGITDIEDGLQRYRGFSIGRHEAFAAKGYDVTRSPASSALGTSSDRVLIYFVASRHPGIPLENPRQVSAFRYPPQYGPRSPTFTRAMIGQHCSHKVLFISGTASIVGHESEHRDDVASQTSEIMANLRALIAECEATVAIPALDRLRCKAYVRNAADQRTVRHIIGAHFKSVQSVLLQAEICRPELLVEVEGVCPLTDAH